MFPAGAVAVTVFVAVSITETVLSFPFVTYTFLPSGANATPQGADPTGTVAFIVFVEVSNTETVLLPWFVTYANGPASATLTSSKIIATETKAIGYNFCLLIIFFLLFKSATFQK